MAEMVEYEVTFGNKSLKFTHSRRQDAFDFYTEIKEKNKVTCSLYEITHKELDWNFVEPI